MTVQGFKDQGILAVIFGYPSFIVTVIFTITTGVISLSEVQTEQIGVS